MSCRILFVDDEPALLRGLRRMLFDLEDRWEMRFAESGHKALAMLEEEPCDVLVTDLQMPGMNGVELLSRVKKRYPHTVRLILSGYSDKNQLIFSVGAAHQFLAKPSSQEEIQSTVERVFSLKDFLCNERVANIVTSLPSLPVLPPTYDELMRIAGSPEGSLQQVAELVTQDMGLTASVLRLVNTAFFGLPCHIDNPTRAVTLLGMETIKALIVLEHFINAFDVSRYPGFSLEHLWKHSRQTAIFTRVICQTEGAEQKIAQQAYTCGLLHDIGKLILAHSFEDAYRAILGLVHERNMPILDAEQEVLDVSHMELGAYLLGLWGFDLPLVRAVACHHAPAACDVHMLVTAVHAANALEHELRVVHPGYAPHPMDVEYLTQAGLAGQYEVWREACRNLDETS